MEEFIRFQALFGDEALQVLQKARVMVAGLGGVGSWCAEALVRSGVGSVVLVDGDVVEKSNLNRQLFATQLTLGQSKSLVACQRLAQINPHAQLIAKHIFVTKESIPELVDTTQPNFIIDAIDSVGPKSQLIKYALEKSIPMLSCLGAGLKKDPTRFRIVNIFDTYMCPLARALRTSLKKLGVYSRIDCLFSDEKAYYSGVEVSGFDGKKFLGSYMPVVATAGLIAADYCIKKLTKTDPC